MFFSNSELSLASGSSARTIRRDGGVAIRGERWAGWRGTDLGPSCREQSAADASASGAAGAVLEWPAQPVRNVESKSPMAARMRGRYFGRASFERRIGSGALLERLAHERAPTEIALGGLARGLPERLADRAFWARIVRSTRWRADGPRRRRRARTVLVWGVARGRRLTGGDGIVRWLLPASVLHAAMVLGAAALAPGARAPERAAPAPRSTEPEFSFELALLDSEGVVAPRAALARSTPFEAAAASAKRPAPRVAVGTPPHDALRVGTEPSRLPAAASLEIASATPALPRRDEPLASAPAANEAPATLSLEQLGIGTNPFFGVEVQPLTQEERANARLQAALHPSSVERDSQLGLGPAGPVAAAARRLVLDDDALVETSAVLNVRVDGSGHVTEVYVLDASSQNKAWQMIAARLAQALSPVTLPVDSQRRLGIKLRLASTVQLPSGAAPGMRFGVLRQQVAGSGGPGSTSLELSPTSKLDLKEPIDSIGRHMDDPIRFEVMLLKLRADPADLGATARRVVEVAVLSIDTPTAP